MTNHRHLQFKLFDLFVFLGFSAIAAWLVSLNLSWLVPLVIAALFGYTGAKTSGHHVLLAMVGGLAFGIALMMACLLTYLTFFHSFRRAIGVFNNIQIALTIIVWLVTLILFLQFRKLTKSQVDVESRSQTP